MKRSEALILAHDEKLWRAEVLLKLDSLTWTNKQLLEVLRGRGTTPGVGTELLRVPGKTKIWNS